MQWHFAGEMRLCDRIHALRQKMSICLSLWLSRSGNNGNHTGFCTRSDRSCRDHGCAAQTWTEGKHKSPVPSSRCWWHGISMTVGRVLGHTNWQRVAQPGSQHDHWLKSSEKPHWVKLNSRTGGKRGILPPFPNGWFDISSQRNSIPWEMVVLPAKTTLVSILEVHAPFLTHNWRWLPSN